MKKQYEKALEDIDMEIKDCANGVLEDGEEKCICAKFPCWRMIAKQAIEKQLETME